jgi:putative flippase GtrA
LPAGLSLLAVLRNPERQSLTDRDAPRSALRGLIPITSQELPRQFAKFIVVGLTNTVLSLVAYVLLVNAGVPYLLASVGAFVLGALNGYSLNRVWTFRAGAFAPSGLLRYATVQCLGLIANAGLLAALVEGVRFDRIPAQAVVLPIVSALTFALNRGWAFRAAAHPRDGLAPIANPSADASAG